jgi:gliding motility-associated-like protein
MKNQLNFIALGVILLFSSSGWGQITNCSITANNNPICLGESSLLSVNANICGNLPSSLVSGLNGWYSFCGNANDLSANANNGSVNGAVLTADYNNINNTAYSFNGTSNTINLSNPFLGGSQVSQFTMNARVKFNSLANSPNIWGKTKFWGEVNFGVDNNGKVYLVWANSITGNKYSSIVSQNSVITANTWYDISIVFQSGSGQIYINGQPVATSLTWSAQGGAILSTSTIENSCNFSQDANSSKFGVAISGGSPVRYLNGVLDEFKIWNYALSPSLIQQNFQSSVTSIIWSDGTTNQSSIQVQPTQTTTYSVTVSDGTDTCTDSLTIQVNNSPAIFQYPDTLLVCSSNILLDASNPAVGNYLWNTGANTATLDVTNSGEYSISVIDTLGCSASDTVYVSIIDPTITVGSSAFCLGDSTLLTVQSSGNSCGALSGTLQNGLVGWWPFCGNANDESGNGNNGTVNGSGVNLILDRFNNNNQAYKFSGGGNILLNNLPTMGNQDFTITSWIKTNNLTNRKGIACWGQDIPWSSSYFYVTSLGFLKFDFAYNGGPQSPIFIADDNWHFVSVTCTNGMIQLFLDGIATSTPIQMSPNINGSNKALGANIDNSGANNFIGALDDIGIWNRALTEQEISTLYNQGNLSTWWSDGTTNQNIIQVQPTQTTTYSITVSDGVGSCTDSITIQVNNPQINAGSDLSVCEGETASLTATGADTYVWDNGIVNGQVFLPTIEGYYTVVGTDTLGCSNTASVFLNLLQPTTSTISPISCDTYSAPDNVVYNNSGQYTAIIQNTAGCDSTITINLTVNNSNSGTDAQTACDSYTWIDGNTYTISTNSPLFTLQNANGCDSIVTLNLTINKLQGLNAGNDITACEGDNITLTALGATTYSWTSGASNGVAFVPQVGSTIYTVIGTDDNGCTAMDSLSVLVEYCLEIPGGISPNGDNNNDTWTINGLNQYPDAIVLVFDRWGQKVFSGDATNPTWNGTYEEKELPTADYYYIIELGNGEKFNGVVTLKR